MSLILDALRKSDVERSRQQAPQVAGAAGAAEPPRERRWLVPVVALLTVNAALLAWVLLRPQAEPVTTAAPTPTDASTPAATSVERPAPEPVSTSRAAPPPAKAVVEPLSVASAGTSVRPEPAATTPPDTPASAVLEADPEPRSAQPARAASTPAPIELPDARALADNGTLAAGALAMELHYYSDAANRRFAFIGGRKVGEGDSLGNGVRVDAVVRNGVVLEHRGRRYLLRRD